MVIACDVLAAEELLRKVESRLRPLDVEIKAERDAEFSEFARFFIFVFF